MNDKIKNQIRLFEDHKIRTAWDDEKKRLTDVADTEQVNLMLKQVIKVF